MDLREFSNACREELVGRGPLAGAVAPDQDGGRGTSAKVEACFHHPFLARASVMVWLADRFSLSDRDVADAVRPWGRGDP
jgi:hypothetical protein